MKKIIIMLMLSLLLLPACASGSEEVAAEAGENNFMSENGTKMNLVIDGKEYVLTLGSGTSAASLATMLPLELSFEDFGGSEKIAYTPESIRVSERGYAPKAGDLCMYIPWGNLCLFYRDYRYSDDLVFIGRLESGIEEIAAIRSDFSARLEIVQ